MIASALVVLAVSAQAQEAEPSQAEADAEEAAIEVIVFGELLVEQARQQVVEDLKAQGYTNVKHKDGRTIYRHDTPYAGEVVLWDDGWMQTRRQKVRVEGREMPWAKKNSPLAWAGCIVWSPLCVRVGGVTYGQRKFRQVESEIVTDTHHSVEVWAERIADLETERKIQTLPARLEALWEEGTPLEGEGPALATMAERRRALFTYWETRTDTPWGDQVREAVVGFVRGVVQHSDDPFTAGELAALEAGSRASRPFDVQPAAAP